MSKNNENESAINENDVNSPEYQEAVAKMWEELNAPSEAMAEWLEELNAKQ